MTTTPEVNTSQVRDLNRLIDWLTKTEKLVVEHYGPNELGKLFVGKEDEDYEDRLYLLILNGCIQYYFKQALKNGSDNAWSYVRDVALMDLVLTASIQSELMFRQIQAEAGLENSYAILDVCRFLPTLVRDLVSLAGSGYDNIDEEKLNNALFTPVSEFLKDE